MLDTQLTSRLLRCERFDAFAVLLPAKVELLPQLLCRFCNRVVSKFVLRLESIYFYVVGNVK